MAHVDHLMALGVEGLQSLLSMLDDPSWTVRRAVIAALAASGTVAIEPLCRMLRTRREDETRIAATVDALSAVSGDADRALIEMITDADAGDGAGDGARARAAGPARVPDMVPILADVAQILGRRRSIAGVPALVRLTRHRDDNLAVAAIEALGRIGGRAAVDSLVSAVKSGNFFRTFPAIDVLGRSGDPRAVGPLTALLAESQYASQAARALGRTGDVSAVAPLVNLFARSSAAMVRVASLALKDLDQRHRERFGNHNAIDVALSNQGTRAGAGRPLLRALGEADPDEQAAICFVLGALRDPSAAPQLTELLNAAPEVAKAAAAALQRLGPHVEEQILKSIRMGDASQRRALLPLVSGAWGTVEVVECLNDGDPDVRLLACDTLARVGAVTAARSLFPLLADPNARVTYAALAAIQSLGGHETQRLAIEAVRSPDARVRRAALRILAYFGSSVALDAFLTARFDPDERVRESAIQGLPFMDDPRALEALFVAAKDRVDGTRATAMRSLGQCTGDPRVGAYLLGGLRDPDPWVRYYACQALGRQAFEPAAEAIARLLGDPAGQVRVAAIEALSFLTSDLAAGALTAAASDADSDIQRAAIIGLGVGRRAESLPLMLAAATSADPSTRLVALSAFAGFKTAEVLHALQAAALDPDESVRTAAIGFLGVTPGIAATRALADMLRTTPSPEPVLAALSVHIEGRVAGLAAALESADDETAAALTSALARLHRADASRALIDAMSMPNVAARKAAAGVLAALATKEALAALRRVAAEDPEAEVRQICSLLLAR